MEMEMLRDNSPVVELWSDQEGVIGTRSGQGNVPPFWRLKGSNVVELLLLVGVLTLIFIRWQVSHRRKKWNKGGRRRVPVAKNLINVPIINGLYNIYQADKHGLKYFETLMKDYGHMNKAKELREIFLKDFLDEVVWMLEAGEWAPRRKILNRSFTHKSIQSYLEIMNRNGKLMSQNMMKTVSSEGSMEGEVDVLPELDFHSIKIIAEIILGPDVMSEAELETFLNTYKSLKDLLLERAHKPYLLIEAIWWLHPKKKELDNGIKLLQGFITNIINKYREKRRLEKEQGIELDDAPEETEDAGVGIKPFRSMMEEMLHGGMSDNEIVNEVIGMMLVGHETSSMAINTLLFFLALHPECQKLCRDEVDHLVVSKWVLEGDDLECKLTMEDVGGLKYLERCILENLRLAPTVPVFVRRLDEPLRIEGNDLELEGNGKNVLLLAWCVHRNPDYWPNPESFDPDRFLPENVKKRPFYSYVPFSGGPKVCMGMKMAMFEMKILMFWILRNFEISTGDKREDINFKIDITLMPDKDFNLILKRRSDM